MSQQQGQYLGLGYELSTGAGLQLRGSEQKLLTACQIPCSLQRLRLLFVAGSTAGPECERA
jgi:hypothetical protein